MRPRIKNINLKHKKKISLSKTSNNKNKNNLKLLSQRKKFNSKMNENLNLNMQHIIYSKKNFGKKTKRHSRSKTATNLIKELKKKIKSKREDIFDKKKKDKKLKLFDKSISKNYLNKEKKLKSLRLSNLILSNSHFKIEKKKKRIKIKKNCKKKKIKKEETIKKNNANFNLKKKIHKIIYDLKNQTTNKNKKNYPILFPKKNDSNNSNQFLLNRFKKPRFQIYKKKNNISEEKYLKRKSQSIRNYFLKKIKNSSQRTKIRKSNLLALKKKKNKKNKVLSLNFKKKIGLKLPEKKKSKKRRKKNYTNTHMYLSNLIKNENIKIEGEETERSRISLEKYSINSSPKIYKNSGSSTPQNQSVVKSNNKIISQENIYKIYSHQNIPNSYKKLKKSPLKKKEKMTKKDILINKIRRGIKINNEIVTNLDFYDFHEVLGEGSYAKVYLATSVLTGKKVAIKCYEQSKLLENKTKKRIIQEIDILKSIKNENIIKIFEIFENDEYLFMVLEYIDNGELLSFLQKNGTFSENKYKIILEQILNSLNYLKHYKILHRDIKLDNILLDTKGTIKICDFGISRKMRKNCIIYEHIGTPAYLAPEIINKTGYSNFSSDIWSLGILTFITLTGTVPFKGETIEELDYQILNKKIDLNKFGFLSDGMKNGIEGMLVKNPEFRISIEDLANNFGIKLKKVEKNDYRIKKDYESIEKLKEFGFSESYIMKCVQNNIFNHVSFLYKSLTLEN